MIVSEFSPFGLERDFPLETNNDISAARWSLRRLNSHEDVFSRFSHFVFLISYLGLCIPFSHIFFYIFFFCFMSYSSGIVFFKSYSVGNDKNTVSVSQRYKKCDIKRKTPRAYTQTELICKQLCITKKWALIKHQSSALSKKYFNIFLFQCLYFQ